MSSSNLQGWSFIFILGDRNWTLFLVGYLVDTPTNFKSVSKCFADRSHRIGHIQSEHNIRPRSTRTYSIHSQHTTSTGENGVRVCMRFRQKSVSSSRHVQVCKYKWRSTVSTDLADRLNVVSRHTGRPVRPQERSADPVTCLVLTHKPTTLTPEAARRRCLIVSKNRDSRLGRDIWD